MREIRRAESATLFTSPVGYTYRGLHYRTWSPHLYTVRRIASLPEIHSRSVKPTEYPPYRRNLNEWSEWDDYWLDRRYHKMPRYTSHSTWPYRRYAGLDTPSGQWWNYPSTYHYPKLYIRHDYYDTYYWRRYNDLRHTAPIYAPQREYTGFSPYKEYTRPYTSPSSYLSYLHYHYRY